MIRQTVLAAVAGAALGGPAAAATANGAGFGMMSCRDALPLLDQPDYRRGFASWALGYLSGINAAMMAKEKHYRDLEGMNADLVIGSLKAACAAEPNAIVLRGAEQLWLTRPSRAWRPQP